MKFNTGEFFEKRVQMVRLLSR